MSRRLLVSVTVGILFGTLLLWVNASTLDASAQSTIVVPRDYPTIQAAIENATDGDTIRIWNGTYYENIVVNKSVSLIGNSTHGTVIDGSGSGDVVVLAKDGASISGVTIRNSGSGGCGVKVLAGNCSISNCRIVENHYGLALLPTWSSPEVHGEGTDYTGMHSSDMDGDGVPEILAGNRSTDRVEIWSYTSGSGRMEVSDTTSAFPHDIHGVATGDFNEDGRLDVVTALRFYGTYITYKTASGWTTPSRLQSRYGNAVTAADLNGDGHQDIFAYQDGQMHIIYGRGDGTFNNDRNPIGLDGGTPNPSMPACGPLSIVDLDGDGDLDLMGTWIQGGWWYYPGDRHDYFVRGFINNGTGASGIVKWGVNASEVLGYYTGNSQGTGYSLSASSRFGAGDINNDGYVDAVVWNYTGSELILLKGFNDSGKLNWSEEVIDDDFPSSISINCRLGDINGDGNIDVIVGGYNNLNGLRVYYGDGRGAFIRDNITLDYGVYADGRACAVGDFNDDGLTDFACPRYLSSPDGFEVRYQIMSKSRVARNTILNNDVGIYLLGSGYKITGNVVENCTRGMFLSGSTGNRIEGNELLNDSYGVYAHSSSGNVIKNTTIRGSSLYNFYLVSSRMTALNSTFNVTDVFCDSNSTLYVKWYLTCTVKDGVLRPIPGAQIKIYDVSGGVVWSGVTGADGAVNLLPISQYVVSSDGVDCRTPHKVWATSGMYRNYVDVLMERSKDVVLVLRDTEPPVYDVEVTTGIQYDRSAAHYDVLASLKKNGRVREHTPDTNLTITVYNDSMGKVVDGGRMEVLDGDMGLYHYRGEVKRAGVYFVVVCADISGVRYVGTTSFEVVEWISEIGGINKSVQKNWLLLTSLMEELNTTRRMVEELKGRVEAVNESIMDRLEELNETISTVESRLGEKMDEMNGTLNAGILNVLDEIRRVNESLADEIEMILEDVSRGFGDLNRSLSDRLMEMLENITEGRESLREWMGSVMVGLEEEIEEANRTLHERMRELEERMEEFYSGIMGELEQIKMMIMDSEKNITVDLDLLNDTLYHLKDMTLEELRERIGEIATALSDHDTTIGSRLEGLLREVNTFENESRERHGEINESLRRLGMLDSVLNKLETLDDDLAKAKVELSGRIEDEGGKQSGKVSINTLLLIVVIILLVVVILLTRKGGGMAVGRGAEAGGEAVGGNGGISPGGGGRGEEAGEEEGPSAGGEG